MVTDADPTAISLLGRSHILSTPNKLPVPPPLGLCPPPPPLERMLGLNPQFQGHIPSTPCFPPTCYKHELGACSKCCSRSLFDLGSLEQLRGSQPPISTPNSLPSPGGNGLGGRSGGRDGGGPPGPPPPPHPMNVPLNMWPLIWNHINK